MTAEQLLFGFATLQAVDLTWADGSWQRKASEMTAFQTEVLHTLGWPPADTYASPRPLLR